MQKNSIFQIGEYTGNDISRELAVQLIKGQEVEIDGRWYESSVEGDLLRSWSDYVAAGKDKGQKDNLLARSNVLTGLIKAKNAQALGVEA